jgi:rod shape-determining protein MreC
VRNVFLFIRRYSTFIFFLVLQIIALSFLFRYNKFHEAAFLNVATEITGKLDERYNSVEYYFNLKRTNDSLVKENTWLHQLVRDNYDWPDSLRRPVVDTIMMDSLRRIQKYIFLDAKVVNSSVTSQNNFLTIHRGSAQGVKPNAGVVGPQGIVGYVVNVSDNYASVMSLLNRHYSVVVKLKKGGERGTVEWDGTSPYYVTLKDIPKSASVKIGDSVVTSPTSSHFPGNLMVGTVVDVQDDKSSNFYTIRLRPSTNFFNIEYVYVIRNSQVEEQKRLEDSTRKKINE